MSPPGMLHPSVEPTIRHPGQLDLARRALAGGPGARRELAQRLRCVPRILAALNQRAGAHLSTEDLEDAAQDVAATIWRRLDAYNGRAAIESWAFGFCQFVLSERLRARARRPRHVEHREDGQHPGDDRGGLDADAVTLVQEALDGIDDEGGELVRLKHFEGMSYAELGASLGISANAAKKRYYKSLARLRTALAPLVKRGVL